MSSSNGSGSVFGRLSQVSARSRVTCSMSGGGPEDAVATAAAASVSAAASSGPAACTTVHSIHGRSMGPRAPAATPSRPSTRCPGWATAADG